MFFHSVDRKKGSKLNLALLLVISCITTLVASIFITTKVSGGGDWLYRIVPCVLTWLILYLTTSYMYNKSIYLFVNAYMLALMIFHFSIVFMMTIGQIYVPDWLIGSQSKWMEFAGWHVVLALSSMGIGIALFGLKKKSNQKLVNNNLANEQVNKFLFQQGLGLFVASIVFLAMAIYSYGNIFEFSRQELYGDTGNDTRGLRVFMMVFPGAATLLALSAQTKTQKVFAYSLAAFCFLLFMISGYRSAALFPLLVGVVIWVKTGRKIPIIVVVGGIAFILVAISVVGIFRSMGSYENLGSQQLEESYEEATVGRSFEEMGATIGVLSHVLRLVPAKDSHIYGQSYWRAFKGMFPNIGFSMDNSQSRFGLRSRGRVNKKHFSKLAPSAWLTYRIKPAQFRSGGGVGFSAVAEPYLNFGSWAVAVFFALLGFLLAKLDDVDLNNHPYVYIFSATMLWPLIRTVRNDFSNFTKPMGFVLLILLIWNICLWGIAKKVKFSKK